MTAAGSYRAPSLSRIRATRVPRHGIGSAADIALSLTWPGSGELSRLHADRRSSPS